ncbi:MAG: hypothetical protein ABIH11_04765 [Candidatus Altiarchaeota archaeon]
MVSRSRPRKILLLLAFLLSLALVLQSVSAAPSPDPDKGKASDSDDFTRAFDEDLTLKSFDNLKVYNGTFMLLLQAPDNMTFNLNHPAVKILGKPIMSVIIPIWEFLIALVGIYYVWGGLSPASRAQAKNMMTKLILGLICCSLAYPIFNLFLDLERFALINVLSAGGIVPDSWDPFTSTPAWAVGTIGLISSIIGLLTFGYGIVLLCPTYCALISMWIMPYMILGMRNIIVLVLGLFFPITILLLSFDFTKGLGNKLLHMSLVWIFVPVSMAVMIVLVEVLSQTPCTTGVDCLPLGLATLAAWLLVAAAPMMMTSLMGAAGGLFISAGRTTGNPRLIFMGGVMRGQGAQALTETAYYSQIRETRVQGPRPVAGDYAKAGSAGLNSPDGYGAPPPAYLIRPPMATGNAGAGGGSSGGGAGGGKGGKGAGGSGGKSAGGPGGVVTGRTAPGYEGYAHSNLARTRATAWLAKYDTHGVWDRGISVGERLKRSIFGMAAAGGLSLENISASQYYRQRAEALWGQGAAGKAMAVAYGLRALGHNLVVTPMMYGVGEFTKGAVRWTVDTLPIGKSLMHVANRMTGMYETKKVMGDDGKEREVAVFNYGWQSHRGVVRDLGKNIYSQAQKDDERRARGEMVLGVEGRYAIGAAVGVGIAAAFFVPSVGLSVPMMAAVGGFMYARMMKAVGREITLAENNKEALDTYDKAEKDHSNWTAKGGLFDRMAAAKSSSDHTTLRDQVWGDLTMPEKQSFGYNPGDPSTEEAAKKKAYDHYMPAAKVKDNVWGAMTMGEKITMVSGARTGSRAGMTVGDQVRRATVSATAEQSFFPYQNLLEREAKRMGISTADAEDNAKRHALDRVRRSRQTKMFGLATTTDLERGGKTVAPDMMSFNAARSTLKSVGVAFTDLSKAEQKRFVDERVASTGESEDVARKKLEGTRVDFDKLSSSDEQYTVISKKQREGLSQSDAEAVAKSGSRGSGRIDFRSLDKETRDRIISQEVKDNPGLSRDAAAKSLYSSGVEFSRLTEAEQAEMVQDIQRRGRMKTSSERWVEEHSGAIVTGVALTALAVPIALGAGLPLLPSAIAGVGVWASTTKPAQWMSRKGAAGTSFGVKLLLASALPGGAIVYPLYEVFRHGQKAGAERARRRATGEKTATEQWAESHPRLSRTLRNVGVAGAIASGLGAFIYGAHRAGQYFGEREETRKLTRMAESLKSGQFGIGRLNDETANRVARKLIESGVDTPMHLANMNPGELSATLANAGLSVGGVDASQVRAAFPRLMAASTEDERLRVWESLGLSTPQARQLTDSSWLRSQNNIEDALEAERRGGLDPAIADKIIYEEMQKAGVQRSLGHWDATNAAKAGRGFSGLDSKGNLVSFTKEEAADMAKQEPDEIDKRIKAKASERDPDATTVMRDEVLDQIHDGAISQSKTMDPTFTHVTEAHELLGLDESGLLQQYGIQHMGQLAETSTHKLEQIFRSAGYEEKWGIRRDDDGNPVLDSSGNTQRDPDEFRRTVRDIRDNASVLSGHGSVDDIKGVDENISRGLQDRGYDTTGDITFARRGQMIESGIIEHAEADVIRRNAKRLSEEGHTALDDRMFQGTRLTASEQSSVIRSLNSRGITDTSQVASAARGDLTDSGLGSQSEMQLIRRNASNLARQGYERLDARVFTGTKLEGDAGAQAGILRRLQRHKGVTTTSELAEASMRDILGVSGINESNVGRIQKEAAKVYAESE